MGLEAKANVVRATGGELVRAEKATVQWEGDAFIVRGDARVKIPRDDITGTTVEGADLVVRHAQGSVRVTLGADVAAKWRDRIASKPRSRLDKMGIGTGTLVRLVNWGRGAPVAALRAEAETAGAIVRSSAVSTDDDVVLLLVEREPDLKRISTCAALLGDTAALWVVHPKGVPVVSDVRIFEMARECGLTYTKVASFSPTHTAEKLVRPVARRAAAVRVGRASSR